MADINFISGQIVDAALEVHKILGPGLLESAYEECLFNELENRGFKIERQKALPVVFKNVKLNCGYRLDLVVENLVVVEIKSVESIAPIHEAQMLTYLKLGKYKVGLLINFNVVLLKDGIIRKIR